MRIDTFVSILKQEQAFFDRSNTGDLISRLTADCGEMAGEPINIDLEIVSS